MTQEKKLNFDVPFLSVRRILGKPKSPIASEKKKTMIIQNQIQFDQISVPICKPDVSFDHLTEPVSVPFTWERIPGQRKENSNCSNSKITLEDEEHDSDEVYSDALDTLSETDSVNCSIGEVSGFENPNLERSGKFYSDDIPGSRDFMMNRFLLAAKAMAMDQESQSSSKKKPKQSNEEQPVTEHKRALIHPIQKHNDVNDDDDDDDDEDNDVAGDDDFSNLAKKGCRFLPRICVKNSLCILNPIPGLKIKTRKLQDPAGTLNKKSQTKTLIRVSMDCANEGKLGLGVQSPGFSGSSRYSTGSKELLTPSWSSRRLSGFISPYQSPSSGSPFRNSRSFGTPEIPTSSRVNRLSLVRHGTSKSQELYPRRPWEIMAEKTVSVYTGSKKAGNSNLGTKRKTDGLRKSCSIQDLRLLVKGGKFVGLEESDDLILDSECKNLGRIKIGSFKTDIGSEASSPVQPPLPTTPSESWLWRTRGSVTPRSSVSDRYVSSRFNPKNPEASKSLAYDTRWETMVKTSFSHHDHVRYSEELITHPSRLISKN